MVTFTIGITEALDAVFAGVDEDFPKELAVPMRSEQDSCAFLQRLVDMQGEEVLRGVRVIRKENEDTRSVDAAEFLKRGGRNISWEFQYEVGGDVGVVGE